MKNVKNISELLGEMIRFNNEQIGEVLEHSSYDTWVDLSDLDIDEEDIEENFIRQNLCSCLRRLDEIRDILEYLSLSGKKYVLTRNAKGFFETKEHEYHKGRKIEFLYYDEPNVHYSWELSHIEFDTDYFIAGYEHVNLEGLTVRERPII